MTAVTLSTVVLNDAEDPTDLLVLGRLTKYSRRPAQGGRTQRVAGGRFRSIVQAGLQDRWTLTLSKVPLDDLAWLEAHIGRLLVVRDDAGRKWFGVYLGLDSEEVARPRSANVDLEVVGVTWSEAVS